MKKISLAILIGALALLSACSSSKETQEWKEVNEMVELNTRLDLSVFKNVLSELKEIVFNKRPIPPESIFFNFIGK